ncbi:nucleolar complex protein 3 homolog [Chelonus insularis]|uniref:nucleolar complex protein 3 homolog n=1 Tax=Chelonus insularis TaxID=460826 RepID=UPI001589664B|nr:nucleolar complex protein 3 homolog [Chelonus insularis]
MKLTNGHPKQTEKLKVRKNKRKLEKENFEEKYEEVIEKMNDEENPKRIRFLLPVKTKEGVLKKRVVKEEITEDAEENDVNGDHKGNVSANDEDSDLEQASGDNELIANLDLQVNDDEEDETVSPEERKARREKLLNDRKIKVGLLASNLLEDPENRMKNLKILIDMMEENTPTFIALKKIVIISLLEVFKDLLPSYRIHQAKQEGVKYKKETLHLQNYESMLLKYYKTYLQKLEKLAGTLRKKKGDTRVVSELEIQLARISISCMCDLLTIHPYFNFSLNITDFLIPYLNNKRPDIRERVAKCFTQIFKEDKKAELSLTIVRKINQLIKLKGNSMHTEVLSILLALRIKNVNLDKEREEDHKQKTLMNHKQRILSLSKRERKRNKKLEQVEKELLETKAEEDKAKSHKILTEITTIVFTIYFRILKHAPTSKLLSVCLEGLAKFAHCINLDFYQDLVNAINHLMENGYLGQREQLHCIQTIFMILSGQGSALNIDPQRFYSHLYRILLDIDLTTSPENCEILIKCLVLSLINRRKRVTQNRLIAFIKRIMIMSLQLHHHEALGFLGIIRSLFQKCKFVDILLDTDSNVGDGCYQPELEEPEHSNASCAALWELAALQRHYHSIVQKLSKNIAAGVPVTGEGNLAPEIAKLSPEELYSEYNPSGLAFKPAVPVPKKVKIKSNFSKNFVSGEFEDYIRETDNTLLSIAKDIDFYKICRKK